MKSCPALALIGAVLSAPAPGVAQDADAAATAANRAEQYRALDADADPDAVATAAMNRAEPYRALDAAKTAITDLSCTGSACARPVVVIANATTGRCRRDVVATEQFAQGDGTTFYGLPGVVRVSPRSDAPRDAKTVGVIVRLSGEPRETVCVPETLRAGGYDFRVAEGFRRVSARGRGAGRTFMAGILGNFAGASAGALVDAVPAPGDDDGGLAIPDARSFSLARPSAGSIPRSLAQEMTPEADLSLRSVVQAPFGSGFAGLITVLVTASGEKWPIAYEGRDVAETGTPFSMLAQRLPKLMIRIKNTVHNVMGTCKSLPGNPRSFAC